MREDPAKLKEILWVVGIRISFRLSWSSTESQARPIFLECVWFWVCLTGCFLRVSYIWTVPYVTKVSGSWAHVLTLALNDYSRPAFSHLRIVALYFHCDLGFSPRVLSQAAGVLLKLPSKGWGTVALVLGTNCLDSGCPELIGLLTVVMVSVLSQLPKVWATANWLDKMKKEDLLPPFCLVC